MVGMDVFMSRQEKRKTSLSTGFLTSHMGNKKTAVPHETIERGPLNLIYHHSPSPLTIGEMTEKLGEKKILFKIIKSESNADQRCPMKTLGTKT